VAPGALQSMRSHAAAHDSSKEDAETVTAFFEVLKRRA
jgi:hypothetical protein